MGLHPKDSDNSSNTTICRGFEISQWLNIEEDIMKAADI
jgi:hypothetical protein